MPSFKLLLPVGISFYTFQTIGYLTDVYRGDVKPEKHLGIFAVFVAFFPQLVAGPIERASTFLPQFLEKHPFDYKRVRDGITLMLWGGFKKVVIADHLGIFVAEVYGNPTEYTGLPSIIATVFFTFQVYCDFSGYSDIAIGAAKVMGFKLMKNFDRPFAARSISEFWRRWHISLSSWIRDYLLMPMAIKKRSWKVWGTIYASMISFILLGIWHGAGWNFIFYGMLFGLAHSVEILTRNIRRKLAQHIPRRIYSTIALLTTFATVNFVLIFFRANNLGEGMYIVRHIIPLDWTIPQFFILNKNQLCIGVTGVLIMEIVQLLMIQKNIWQGLCESSRWIRWPLYYALIIAICCFGDSSQQEFIYFQF
jgi:D-alanyl-lipoteichoic acid acyltransferase DltB (MBOAT superfamily)